MMTRRGGATQEPGNGAQRRKGRGGAHRGGVWRAALARLAGDSDDPLQWAITLGRVAGVRLRVHLFFVLFAGVGVLYSLLRHEMGAGYAGLGMTALLLVTLAHEAGRVAAARALGGEADDVLLWPLGGLVAPVTPDTLRAGVLAACAGPATQAALLVATSGAMTLAGLREAVVFHPLRLGSTLSAPIFDQWWKVGLFWLHAANALVLAANLAPILPLDWGRGLRAALRRLGPRRAGRVAANVGLAGAAGLGVVGLVTQVTTVAALAVFAGMVCWSERRRLSAPEFLGGGFDLGLDAGGADAVEEDAEELRRRARPEIAARETERRRQAEVDRILAKISAGGIESLTPEERAVLDAETRRRRGG